ncbi:hypothetical protein [Desulfosporosinus shakirovi]|uniref:hypothetical protein n=1 Tax=Desulfosporosinus shakirovi TaxID=2885154 RepID=UPI001E4C6756|nr:hypothetical protein [Desulfosporosinus sp. SRJS8]MCB8814594.1 hypothetical protein [Desulfosporosinus sp. SRJS8]
MNKKVLMLGLAVCLSSIITGCSNSQRDEVTTLNKSYDIEKQKNIELEIEKAVLNEKLESINKRQEKQVAIITTLIRDSASGVDIYPIYSADVDNYINNYNKEIDFYIAIPKEDSLKSKLDTIAKSLSETYFGNLPIKVLEFDDKKIVTIDLEETSEMSINTSIQKNSSWATGFFQGSTGGTITTIRLIESFLQKDYQGEWVEGIRFSYKGQPVDFEHTPELSKVIYRR